MARPQLARNMAEFTKSPLYLARKAKLDKVPSTPKSKDIKFNDGSVIHLSLDKKAPTGVVAGVVKKQVGKPKKETSADYDCTVTTVNLTSTSDNFLNNDYSGSTAHIYPGACYTYANLTNGSWKEQTGARNPIMITTDNPNIKGLPYVVVQNPNDGTLYAAVDKLLAGAGKTTGNESLAYQVTDAENSATYNLQIGAAASGFGVDLSNVYSTGNQSNHVHLTIDATKTLFTIMTAPPDSGFFKDPKIEATPDLSIIGEVSYGVRVLANADITFESQQEADNFKAGYSGFGVSVSLNVNYGSSSKNTTANINGYIIGGPGNTVVAYSLAELKSQIEKVFAGATYQNARPIKYKAYSMAGDVLNTYSATDDFNERSCVPVDGGSPEIESVSVTFRQGSDGKEAGSFYWLGFFTGMNAEENPHKAMFIYNSGKGSSGNQKYNDNGDVTVVLTPNKEDFKGRFDLATFEKDGGHLFLSPLTYPNNSDVWKIDAISIVINLKPNSANPNPKAVGQSLRWSLMGGNEVRMEANTKDHATFFFDRNFAPQGHQ